MPSFSEDGKTVYMMEPLHGTTLLYRLSLAAGSPQFLWAGLYAVESPKQNLLLYAKSDQLGIYARSLRGDLLKNPEIQIVPDYLPPYGKFQPVDDGIYYVSYSPGGLPRAFSFYSFATKQSLDIAPCSRWLLWRSNSHARQKSSGLYDGDKKQLRPGSARS